MVFTPKFVDLVRNYTSIIGTGPITVGGAISGYTSFTDAVIAGDQCYYCVQGIDKPVEREVGRGTMQANGTIVRDPVGGTLYGFTRGSKSISLVTAAEWFTKVEAAGSSGGGGGATSAATRAALAALATGAGKWARLTEAGRSGDFQFDPSNLSARVAADTAQAIHVAPASAPTGASGAWVRQHDGRLSFDWFGAVPGDYSTGIGADCVPAWAALNTYLAAVPRNISVGYQATGPEVYFPGNQYYFSDTIQLKRTMRLKGMGVGQPSGEPTWLRFPVDKAGIVVNESYTNGDVQQSPTTTTAAGSIIEGFLLQGGGLGARSGVDTADLLYSGIRLRARATIRDCVIRNFRGAGICISAAVGDGTNAFHGNANNWKVDNCRLEGNKTYGLYVSGGDANAGVASSIDASFNGKFGFYDGAFLGNSYLGCHADGNGLTTTTGLTETGTVTFGGRWYFLRLGTSLATAQATTPGTNPLVWSDIGVGAAGPAYPAWVNTGNYLPTGAYGQTGSANGAIFTGCYYETGQAPPQLSFSAVSIGGFMLDGLDDGGAQLRGNISGLSSNRAFIQRKAFPDGSYVRAGVGGTFNSTLIDVLHWNSSVASPSNPDYTYSLTSEKATNDLCWIFGGAFFDQDRPFRLTAEATARTYGATNAEAKRSVEIRQLALGSANAARLHTSLAAVPTTGTHAVGEVVWNDGAGATSVTAVDHWRCSVAGTPGTWLAVVGDGGTSLSGDLTGTRTAGTAGLAATIAAGAVTLAKQANVATGTIFYRKTAAAGAPEVQSLATLKTDLGLTGTNSGDQTITLTGDVTGGGVGSFAATIGAGAVTFSKFVAATQAAFVGSTGAGNFGELTATTATAQLNAMVGSNGTVAGTKGMVPVPAAADNGKFLRGDATWAAVGAGAGTVTSASVVSANGVSGSVATATTTPAITLTLGAITPTSVAASGAVSGSNLSGTNTGDQTVSLTGDVTGSGTGSFAATIAAGAVTLAKQANVATGTIFYRKTAAAGAPEVQSLATLKTDLGLTGTNSGDQTITLTGDVTGGGVGSFAATIGAGAVTFSKFVAATQAAFVGSTGAGNFGELTATTATAQLNAMVGSNGTVAGTKGLVPAPAVADNVKVLRGDATWLALAAVATSASATDLTAGTVAAARMPALTGDVTTAAGAVATTIGAGAVTLAKMANLAAVSLVGNATGAAAVPAALTLAGGLAFSGTTLTAAGALTPTSLASSGALTSSSASAGIGYATGAGGTVTQATSRTTGVTLAKTSGAITLFSTTTTAGQTTTLTVTNTAVAATDTVVVSQKSGTGIYVAAVSAVAAGSFNLSIYTPAAVGAAEAPVFNFAVIKAVTA